MPQAKDVPGVTGKNVTPMFDGTMNGPVEVTASGPVMASQRVT